MAHNIKPGVATGDQVQEIFNYAKEKGFALPAVNVTGSSTINGVLETAAKLNAPVIIQFSNGGAQFNAGKGLSNAGEKSAIAGGIAGAKHPPHRDDQEPDRTYRKSHQRDARSHAPVCAALITADAAPAQVHRTA